jgi:hypothetical protein
MGTGTGIIPSRRALRPTPGSSDGIVEHIVSLGATETYNLNHVLCWLDCGAGEVWRRRGPREAGARSVARWAAGPAGQEWRDARSRTS